MRHPRSPRDAFIALFIGLGALLLIILFISSLLILPATLTSQSQKGAVVVQKPPTSSKELLQESSDQQTPEDFWLNSGAWAFIENDTIATVHGALPHLSYWRIAYRLANPTDTDLGYHPQNLFRLVTTAQYQSSRQELFFRIDQLQMSSSTNRNESNGVLLMSRYQDENNLYYAGLRVDGYAVIKRKQNGVYTTLAYVPVSPGSGSYDRNARPLLIPEHQWIGLRLTTDINARGVARLTLETNTDGTWKQTAAVTDPHGFTDATARRNGIRSDFMDVTFKAYESQPLELQSLGLISAIVTMLRDTFR